MEKAPKSLAYSGFRMERTLDKKALEIEVPSISSAILFN